MKSISEFDINLGINIEYYRVMRGYSRKFLAEKLNITQQQLQKYERGKNRITVSRLKDLCNALNIDINLLFGSKIINKIEKHQKIIFEIMQIINSLKDLPKLYSIKNLVKAFIKA